MPAKDRYHDIVKEALIKDSWTITHDPYRLSWGGKDLYVDLGPRSSSVPKKAREKSPWRSRVS